MILELMHSYTRIGFDTAKAITKSIGSQLIMYIIAERTVRWKYKDTTGSLQKLFSFC